MKKLNFANRLTSLFLACLLLVSTSASVLAQNQTETFSETLAASSGKTYGPWFGSSHETFSNAAEPYAIVVAVCLGAFGGFLPSNIAKAIAGGTATALGFVSFEKHDFVYGTIDKRYREVYVAGEFAYFQTEFVVNVYTKNEGFVKKFTKYMEGNAPLSLDNEINAI